MRFHKKVICFGFVPRRISVMVLVVSLFCCSCGSDPGVDGGEILIRNDILDSQYNSFVVDQVITDHGVTGFSALLHPGQKQKIPQKNIVSLRFTRKYADHSMVYVVECPPGLNKRVTMKLIDVHSNRIGDGDCLLTKRGRSTGGIIEWEKEK